MVGIDCSIYIMSTTYTLRQCLAYEHIFSVDNTNKAI